MTLLRVSVKLNKKSGIPEDAVVNVWHFDSIAAVGSASPTVTGLTTALKNFYQEWSSFMHVSVSRAALAHTMDMRAVTSGSPGASDDVVGADLSEGARWQLVGASGSLDQLPCEVASCLSFSGILTGVPEETGATRPRSHRRGRVYLGPFDYGCVAVDATTGRTYMANDQREVILDAYETLRTAALALPVPLTHGIYSPTEATFYGCFSVWMDDAFDIIRSRGEKALTRNTHDLT